MLLSAGLCFVMSAPQCSAQSILNQSSEELLKDFDVDPNQVASQYQPRPAGKTERFLQMLGGLMSKSNSGTNSGTNAGRGSTFGATQGGNLGTIPGFNFGAAQGNNPGTTPGFKSSDNGTLRVRAPFVKLDMINGERCIRVDAPFLTYDSNPNMSAMLRNQESSAAAMPPAPVSPVPLAGSAPDSVSPCPSFSPPPSSVSPDPSFGSAPGSVSPGPSFSSPPSVTPAIPDSSLTNPPSIDSLPAQTSPANLLEGSGASGKAGRMRIDRSTAFPNQSKQGR